MASPLPLKRKRIESSECVSDASSARLSPVVLLSSGTGCTASSDWMNQWKQILKDSLDAVEVICVDDVYSDHSKSYLWSLSHYTSSARREYPGHPLVLAGRSFGARMCCLIAADEYRDFEVSAVICFGYPVEGIAGAVQDEKLSRLEVPVIFIQGSRDVFCPLEKLEILRKKMMCYNELHVIDGGNHSLSVGKKHLLTNGLTQDEVETKVSMVVTSFIFKCLRVLLISPCSHNAFKLTSSVIMLSSHIVAGEFCCTQINPVQAATSVFPSKKQNKDGSLSPVVVFAPGTSTPMSSDWMIRWKAMLKNALDAVEVITFDYPYMSGEKKKAPPKAEKLVKFHKDIVKQTVEKYPGHPLILAGKAIGARVSCMVATELDVTAAAVICLGYPLKSIIRATKDNSLMELRIPTMFVQGSNDVFCPFDMLQAVRQKLKCQNRLHVVDGGDHSLKLSMELRLKEDLTQHESDMDAVEAVASFVSSCLKSRLL
ncbi:KAT8 regulatory NSL complex subunit 3 [Linum perenne]